MTPSPERAAYAVGEALVEWLRSGEHRNVSGGLHDDGVDGVEAGPTRLAQLGEEIVARHPRPSEVDIHPGGDQDSSASSTARAKTASSIGSVRRLVNVFCWLGWYEQTRTGRPSTSTPCPKAGRGRMPKWRQAAS